MPIQASRVNAAKLIRGAAGLSLPALSSHLLCALRSNPTIKEITSPGKAVACRMAEERQEVLVEVASFLASSRKRIPDLSQEEQLRGEESIRSGPVGGARG
ncbi:hypothetical protein VULLAG_LOCUS7290 [Vulpes lagopus]